MIERIDAVKRAGNTLGGICEVVVDGLPGRTRLARLVGPQARRPHRRGDACRFPR